MKNKWLLFFIVVFSLSFITLGKPNDIFPMPQSISLGTDEFPLESFQLIWKIDDTQKAKLACSFNYNTTATKYINITISDAPELSSLGKEAYLIEINQQGGRIIGASERALYYAINTFNQLIEDTSCIPEIQIIDGPDYPIRGVIEGFYDTPWSHSSRTDIIHFLGSNKMNTFVYAPKDDPYHREKWRDPYPESKLAELKELVDVAKDNYVDFVFAISPGVSIEFSSEADWNRLIRKTDAMIEIGVTHFALLLDDIDPHLRSARDRAKYGNNYALAQVDLCNRYQEYLKTKIPEHRLIVVPTEYYQEGTSPYRRTYAQELSQDIIVYSTGYGIVAETLTKKEASTISEIWQHEIVYWDNYPVNDYNRTKLLMAPLAGRGPTLSRTLGFTFNPMNEAELSKLPLLTCADYTWNSKEYSPTQSWEKAVAILGGSHQEIYRRFAEQNLTFFKDGPTTEYPTLIRLAESFFSSYKTYTDALKLETYDLAYVEKAKENLLINLGALKEEFRALENIKRDFEEFFPVAAKEATQYLKRLENWGKIGSYYTDMLRQVIEAGPLSSDTNSTTKLEQYSLALESYLKGMTLNRFDALSTAQIGSSTVALPIIDNLARLFTANFSNETHVATTNMPIWQNYVPSNAVDGDSKTLFWSSRSQRLDDYFMVDLGRIETFSSISLLMGNGNLDYFYKCKVEISKDSETWEEVAIVEDTPNSVLNFPNPKEARYLKVTSLSEKEYWVMIRQFEPTLPKKDVDFNYNATLMDVFNKIAVEPFFIIEDEITITLETPAILKLAGLLQDPTLSTTWELSYSLDGENFIGVASSDSLVQIIPLPQEPIKKVRFKPTQAGIYLRSLFVIPED
ncbi:MAG: beta-N-acetylglucosaminidase domain-containing protein [Firmicutes bacterium]|nr:beta-N-acetylglucosaminidase domain-containing protein [Bacillota bacterium]MDD4263977.1 beta-N-acetylglucosaminidase domain-containing protein [Bacillota bacterium]MDD4693187.1 beta-N-acetylglucosaminidase domain-containing protein [Bacillota bacterium]